MSAKFIEKPRIEIILTNTESNKNQIYKETFAPRLVRTSGTNSTCNYFVGSNEIGDDLLNKLSLDKRKCLLDIDKTKKYIKDVEVKFLSKLDLKKFYGELQGFYEAKKYIELHNNNLELIGFRASFSASDKAKRSRIMMEREQNEPLKYLRELLIGIVANLIFEIDEDKNIVYPEIKNDLEKSVYDSIELLEQEKEEKQSEKIGYNKIFYGIPGCGKSYHIEHVVLKGANKKENVFRTTFYLDYSNTDFVGQIYPVVEGSDVTYKRVPGPFTKALTRAYQEPNEMIYLVIEEINRGNAAAIFGDLFQLLDRLKEDYDGRFIGDSEYPISNEFIEGYLEENGITDKKGNIYIPRNLTILATMNTSDQNVFPLDTAFKRRWDRKRVIANWDDWYKANGEKKYIPFTDFTWESFVKIVNEKMLKSSQDGMILEDKQIGAFFASSDFFVTKEEKDNVTPENKKKLVSFLYNVIDYIYTDVSKFDREKWFKEKLSLDGIINKIYLFEKDDDGNEIFKGDKTLCMILQEKANEADVDVDNNDYDE